MSTLETMILPCLIAPHREVTFVVKESLVSHPLFGHVMRSRNPVVVGRTDARKDFEIVMSKGTELLSEGVSVIIFPRAQEAVFIRKSLTPWESNWQRRQGSKLSPWQ